MSRTAAVSAAAVPVVSMAVLGLIGLQEDDGPQLKDRAARRQGDRVLGALGRVQVAALGGSATEALAALNDAVTSMTEAADPVLVRIIGAIRLRARVELARRDAEGRSLRSTI